MAGSPRDIDGMRRRPLPSARKSSRPQVIGSSAAPTKKREVRSNGTADDRKGCSVGCLRPCLRTGFDGEAERGLKSATILSMSARSTASPR